jgi:hypothetical protein
MSLRDINYFHFMSDCQDETQPHNALIDAQSTIKVFGDGYQPLKRKSASRSERGNVKPKTQTKVNNSFSINFVIYLCHNKAKTCRRKTNNLQLQLLYYYSKRTSHTSHKFSEFNHLVSHFFKHRQMIRNLALTQRIGLYSRSSPLGFFTSKYSFMVFSILSKHSTCHSNKSTCFLR